MGWIENMLYACNLKFLNYESKKTTKKTFTQSTYLTKYDTHWNTLTLHLI